MLAIKKSWYGILITMVALGSVFSVQATTPETPQTATTRMEKIADLMKSNGADRTFRLLNETESLRGVTPTDGTDYAEVLKSTDPNSFVFCIENDKIVVHQRHPHLIGKDVKEATGVFTKDVLDKMIAAMRAASDGKVTVDYTITEATPDGKTSSNSLHALLYSIKALLGKKDPGKKFFCAVTYK